MLQHNKIANIYNPLNQSYEELLSSFVIRKKEFNRVRKELRVLNGENSIQHFLIEGQRGTGKTTLLLRLRYEIENSKEFSHLVAVQFGEEQYGIFDLCRVWENVAEILEDIEGFETLSDELDKRNEDKNYSTECFSIVEKYLKKNNKRLVLLLDNFGDILDKLSEIEQKRLRDTLHESKYVQLVTATSRTLEYTYKHDQPFFEFFKKIKLEGLDKENTQILLKQLSMNIDNDMQDILNGQPNRIEVIRRLTGGIPRTIVLLFEIFLDDSANVFEDLEAILDRVTPLYKHRMDDLPKQQQAIMDTIALNWDGISTKEITEGLKKRGFNTKQVSSQLKVLERHDLIESRFIDKKNKVYLIKERFFNIWYLMRYGRRKSKQQVLWLVRFLEEWCDDDELEKRARNHIRCAQENKLHLRGGVMMAEALACTLKNTDLQHEVLSETKKAFKSILEISISKSDKELFEEADKFYHENKFDLAISKSEILIDKGYVQAMYNLGTLYHHDLKDFNLAIKYYTMAIEENHIESMHNLAVLYEEEYQNIDLAIKYYSMAIKNGNMHSMNDLALFYEKKKEYEKSIKYYKMAIEKGSVFSIQNLANLYEKLTNYTEATKYYELAIEKGEVEEIFSLASMYEDKLKDYDKAIYYYNMAIEKNLKNAYAILGLFYKNKLNDFHKAEEYLLKATDEGNSDAYWFLANMYVDLKDNSNAIKYLKEGIRKGNHLSMNQLAWLYYEENMKKIESLELCENFINKENLPLHLIHTYAVVLLWNDMYTQSLDTIRKFIINKEDNDFIDDLIEYFLLLMAKKQYNSAYKLFIEFKNLKDQIKPIYYALMKILKEKYPKEYLKMGSELEETVEEVLIKVEKKREEYC